jgi:hypothetical protein
MFIPVSVVVMLAAALGQRQVNGDEVRVMSRWVSRIGGFTQQSNDSFGRINWVPPAPV